VIRTFEELHRRGKRIYVLSNGCDLNVVQRIVASGLAPYLSGLVAIRTRAPEGMNPTFVTERRARILARCPSSLAMVALESVAAKPNAAGILTVLDMAAIDPEDAVYAGDLLALDGVAAAGAGVPFAHIQHGAILTSHHWDAVYAGAPLEEPPASFSNSVPVPVPVPVRLEALCYEELLSLF
jgi:FMN phosphatase YigB (HAD superfamily)